MFKMCKVLNIKVLNMVTIPPDLHPQRSNMDLEEELDTHSSHQVCEASSYIAPGHYPSHRSVLSADFAWVRLHFRLSDCVVSIRALMCDLASAPLP